jgi:hypothetical protein
MFEPGENYETWTSHHVRICQYNKVLWQAGWHIEQPGYSYYFRKMLSLTDRSPLQRVGPVHRHQANRSPSESCATVAPLPKKDNRRWTSQVP